jgi:hypothetical protein
MRRDAYADTEAADTTSSAPEPFVGHSPSGRRARQPASDDAIGSVDCSTSISRS